VLNHMSLFTGIGGWELALQMADIQTRTILVVPEAHTEAST